jgi:hypothetical protein
MYAAFITTWLVDPSSAGASGVLCHHQPRVYMLLHMVFQCRDPVKCHRSLQMEELQHNLLGLMIPFFWWPHVNRQGQEIQMLPDIQVRTAWGHLVQIAVFNLTEQTFEDQDDLVSQANRLRNRHILPLGKLLEQVRGNTADQPLHAWCSRLQRLLHVLHTAVQ